MLRSLVGSEMCIRDRKNSDRSTSRGRDQSSRRQNSQSRGNSRNRQDSRGRSSERRKPKESKGSRSSSLCAEIEACQYYSVHSQSPNRRKVSIPSVFRRPLTPRSFNHMKGNYFLDTSGAKYKDVRSSGRCLLCYSSKHKAAMCDIFTRPTPTPWKKCHYLFHNTEECPYYSTNNRSRGPSLSKSPIRSSK